MALQNVERFLFTCKFCLGIQSVQCESRFWCSEQVGLVGSLLVSKSSADISSTQAVPDVQA